MAWYNLIMAIRKIPFAIGENFHVYNRGNSKQVIFCDDYDSEYFTKLMFLANGENSFKMYHVGRGNEYDFDRGKPLVNIGAYCLMPNHFHLLLTQSENGSISKFMQKLSTGYSMYFNNKYERTGTLFEGKFKSQHVDDDRYLKYLFSYIHLNPLKLIDSNWKDKGVKNKAQATSFLEDFLFSSYLDYLGKNRKQGKILNSESFPSYFSSMDSIKKEIFDWINLV